MCIRDSMMTLRLGPAGGTYDPALGVDEPGGDVACGEPANCLVTHHDCRSARGVRGHAGGAGGTDGAPRSPCRLTGERVKQVVPYDAPADPPSGGRAGRGQPAIRQVNDLGIAEVIDGLAAVSYTHLR